VNSFKKRENKVEGKLKKELDLWEFFVYYLFKEEK